VASVFPVARCGPGRLDPWKKGIPPRRRHRLWPGWFWRALCDVAKTGAGPGGTLSGTQREMIGDMNERLYGRR
jgi:hypothetical protein